MRIVFAGTPQVAVPTLEALLASQHDVPAVITRPDMPSGRGRRIVESAVAATAHRAGVEVLKPAKANDGALAAKLREIQPQLCVVVAYGALLGDDLLAIPPRGWINIHFSVLPRWRGAAPVQRAIIAGDTVTGTTCFQIVKELDAGDIITQDTMPMPDATAGEVLNQLASTGATQILDAIALLESGITPRAQPQEGITYANKLSVDEVRLNFTQTAHQLRNLIMGASPEPGAWCEYRGDRFKIYRAAVAQSLDLAPGVLAVSKRAVVVGTGEGTVELLEVQPAGRKRMPAIDWARNGADGEQLT